MWRILKTTISPHISISVFNIQRGLVERLLKKNSNRSLVYHGKCNFANFWIKKSQESAHSWNIFWIHHSVSSNICVNNNNVFGEICIIRAIYYRKFTVYFWQCLLFILQISFLKTSVGVNIKVLLMHKWALLKNQSSLIDSGFYSRRLIACWRSGMKYRWDVLFWPVQASKLQ